MFTTPTRSHRRWPDYRQRLPHGPVLAQRRWRQVRGQRPGAPVPIAAPLLTGGLLVALAVGGRGV
ncbi:MAG TPA: hypothetical protein VFB73_02430 [Chloroflexota bacterium]|nr:hypothetical protein [Chloroflexota bacterium]